MDFPEAIKAQMITESRPGTNGHSLWFVGMRGTPKQVVTVRDCEDMNDAANAYANYLAAIGGRYQVIYAGKQFSNVFDLVNVETVENPMTAYGVGGTLGLSTALLVCRWTLIPQFTPA